jgi:hypothetical protein
MGVIDLDLAVGLPQVEELTVDDASDNRGSCRRADTANDAPAAQARRGEFYSRVGLVELVGESTMDIADVLTPKRFDKGRNSTRVHRRSPVTCEARRSARCCNTFAFPTLMFIA